jgi:hypothetical protein
VRICYTTYVKAGPVGGLRPPSGPAATLREPGTGLTHHAPAANSTRPVEASFPPPMLVAVLTFKHTSRSTLPP